MSEIVVIIRPSFMKFCKDGCRAALFNHILYWIAQKTKDQPQDKIQAGEIAYYATTEELVEQLAGAWGVCKVRQEVNMLITMGIIGRGRNPAWGVDRTKHFFFGKDQCAKLLQLCQDHAICLHHIGLSADVKQMIDLSNASDKSIKCSCSKQMIDSSLANDKSIGAITKDSTKDSKPKDSERKKGESVQSSHVVTQENVSIHSSPQPTSFVAFTEDEQVVYDLAKQKHISRLKRDERHKEYCAQLANQGVTTLEQIESLIGFCRQKPHMAVGRELYLKNLVNELDGWMQTRTPVTESLPELPGEPMVTDEELAADVRKHVRAYQGEEHFDKHLERILAFRRMAELSNYTLCEKMTDASRKAPARNHGIEDFLEQLRQDLYW